MVFKIKSSKKTDSFHTSDGPSSLDTAAGNHPYRAYQAGSAKENNSNRLEPFAHHGNQSVIQANTSVYYLTLILMHD